MKETKKAVALRTDQHDIYPQTGLAKKIAGSY
jgi:hypothetical protein